MMGKAEPGGRLSILSISERDDGTGYKKPSRFFALDKKQL